MIYKVLSYFLYGLGAILFLPLLIAVYCEFIAPAHAFPQHPSSFAFMATILIAFVIGSLFYFMGKNSSKDLYRREALLLVLLFYLSISLIGSLPFYLSKTLSNPIDAFFETVSGFTTTGATVMEAKKYDSSGKEIPIEGSFEAGKLVTFKYFGTITPVRDGASNDIVLEGLSALSPALIFWRSLSQCLGGGGIVILFVAILPLFGVGGKIFYEAEITGPQKESLAPRIKEAASKLWKVYLSLILIETIILSITNRQIPIFDALVISFSTLSTGGFTPHEGSIGAYNCLSTEIVVMIFMVLGSINFSLYFFTLKGKFYRLNDPELQLYLLLILTTSLFAAFTLYYHDKTLGFGESLRQGSFQLISAISTTGFFTANYDVWPFSIQTLMLIVMFIGGMAGSTAGGIKVIRLQMFFRILTHKIESLFRPDTVRAYKIRGILFDQNVAMTVLCFLMVAASFTIVGTFIFVVNNIDQETSLTSMACFLNSIGLGFRMGGPLHTFAFLSDGEKLLSCLFMIAGRLEYFIILLFLFPSFWRRT